MRLPLTLLTALVAVAVTPSLEAASLAERLAHYRVPGVSVAVIGGHRVAWACGYGVADAATRQPVTPRTLFQAASISKPVAATAALRLVERGALALDEDVTGRLRRWRLPRSEGTGGHPVTLRGLLSHTAGTTVSGFPGYARDRRAPTAVEVLDGAGNTPPVRVDGVPGTAWRYSGGGYTVVQVLLADLAGRTFPDLMAETVLDPIGMRDSTYEQPLPPARRRQAASGHRPDGRPIDGGWHVYPEMAAAGLWTTPSDLARWAIAIQQAHAGAPRAVLSAAMARQLLTPGLNGWGLGPAISADGARFHHGGANAGFRAHLVAPVAGGQGIVVMANSDNGTMLIAEIVGALARRLGWRAEDPPAPVIEDLDRCPPRP